MKDKQKGLVQVDLNDLFAQERSYCVMQHILKTVQDTKDRYVIEGRTMEILVTWRETRNWFDMELRFMRNLFERLDETALLNTLDSTSEKGQQYIDNQFGQLIEMSMAIRNSTPVEV